MQKESAHRLEPLTSHDWLRTRCVPLRGHLLCALSGLQAATRFQKLNMRKKKMASRCQCKQGFREFEPLASNCCSSRGLKFARSEFARRAAQSRVPPRPALRRPLLLHVIRGLSARGGGGLRGGRGGLLVAGFGFRSREEGDLADRLLRFQGQRRWPRDLIGHQWHVCMMNNRIKTIA